jgi:hypothetical protein
VLATDAAYLAERPLAFLGQMQCLLAAVIGIWLAFDQPNPAAHRGNSSRDVGTENPHPRRAAERKHGALEQLPIPIVDGGRMHPHQDFAFLWNRPFDLSDFEYVGQTIAVANQRFHSSFRALATCAENATGQI